MHRLNETVGFPGRRRTETETASRLGRDRIAVLEATAQAMIDYPMHEAPVLPSVGVTCERPPRSSSSIGPLFRREVLAWGSAATQRGGIPELC